MSVRLSLIVPAYNEAARIDQTLDSITGCLEDRAIPYEVIVVADGNDGTRELLMRTRPEPKLFTVLGSPERRGKGYGIRTGVALAKGSIIGFVDADGKTPIEEIEKILPFLEQGFDVVIGSRGQPGSVIEVPQPLYRRIGSRLFGLAM